MTDDLGYELRCLNCEATGRPPSRPIARIVGGPDVRFRVVLIDERQPGDIEVRCPVCRTFYYVRVASCARGRVI